MTNAVVHAGTDFDLTLERRRGALLVTVGDRYSARTLPAAPMSPPEDSEGGRGLFLIATIAERWGVVHSRTGKHVWFELPLTGDAAPVGGPAPASAPAALTLAAAQVASLTAGPDGVVTGWGGDAERMFGWTGEQVVGRPLAELATLDGDPTSLHEHTMAHGRWYGSVRVRHVDGDTIQVYGVHLAAEGDDEGIACLWTRHDSRALLEPPVAAARRAAVDGPGPRAGLGRLLGLADSVVSRLTLDELLEQTLERLCTQTGGDASYVVLLTEDGAKFEIRAAYGLAMHDSRAVQHGGAEGITGRLSRQQMPIVVPDIEGEPGLHTLRGSGLRALVAAPLVVEGRLTGAIHIASRTPGRFTNDDAVALQHASDQLALAIESARLGELERRRRGWLAYLAEASDLLAGTLDLDMTMALLAQLVVPAVAEWCSLHLEQDGEPELSYVWHADESRIDVLRAVLEAMPAPERRTRSTSSPAARRQAWRPPAPTAELVASVATTPAERAIAQVIAADDRVSLPLVARNRTLGAIVIGRSPRSPFTADEIELAGDLTRRAALAIDNARLYRDRVAVARALQRSLLPPEAPVISGCDVGVSYLASGAGNEVGGDFYDVFPIDGTRWGVAIGDVCGKGAEAAAVTGLARHTIRLLGREGRPVTEVLGRLNRAILDEGPRSRFLTAIYADLLPTAAGIQLTICAAGHPLPLVSRTDGHVRTIGEPQSLLGVLDEPDLQAQTVHLTAGETLVLYTDGVTERRFEGRMLGEDGLAEVLRANCRLPASALASRIERAVVDFQREPPRDDMAVLVIRVL